MRPSIHNQHTQPTVATGARILLVDDESAFCELCSLWLQQAGHQVTSCGDAEQARQAFQQDNYDVVLQDLALPPTFRPEEGLQLLPMYGDVPVIVLTGHDQRELAIKAMQLGAWDFIGKPIDPDLLQILVLRAQEKRQLRYEVEQLQRQLQSQTHRSSQDTLGLIGASESSEKLRELIRRIAPTEVPVLIQGPSGTGKELIAQALHQHSPRRSKPLIAVHCGAIPAELFESELFGHKKGAFTGADRDRPGLLAQADGGSLFLDEIGEMPLPMQVKLLRVLQEGTYYPVGSHQLTQLNTRLISATNRDLNEAVNNGQFRDDLYYRIKGLPINTVPLAQRRDDIPLLANHFLQHQDQPLQIDAAALQWLCLQPWPGNVRELKNLLDSATALCQGENLSLHELSFISSDIPPNTTSHTGGSLEQQVKALEIRLLERALQQHQGNRTHAAQALGLTRQGLLKKIQRYGLTC